MSTPQVMVETHQNEFLPAEGRTVDAVITVTQSGDFVAAASPRGSAAEIIMIDVSASMSSAELRAAKEAAVAAIDIVPDGVAFGIVAGDTGSWPVYPGRKELVVSSPANRSEARSAVQTEFVAMTAAALGKTRADVVLRLWTPAGSTIRFVKQVHPEIIDLTGRRVDAAKRVGEYPIGAWGAESRDYHVCIDVEPSPVGEEVLAARVSVVHADEVLGQSLVRAVWTDDVKSTTTINRQVAHYQGETELADSILEGTEAQKAGDVERATAKLGRAVRLAAESGRTDTAKLLAKVVDVVDERTGTVRLRKVAASIDAEMAAVGSRKTQQVRSVGPGPAGSPGSEPPGSEPPGPAGPRQVD